MRLNLIFLYYQRLIYANYLILDYLKPYILTIFIDERVISQRVISPYKDKKIYEQKI